MGGERDPSNARNRSHEPNDGDRRYSSFCGPSAIRTRWHHVVANWRGDVGKLGGQNSPMLSLCAQQWTHWARLESPMLEYFQVLGGGNSDGGAQIHKEHYRQLTRTRQPTRRTTPHSWSLSALKHRIRKYNVRHEPQRADDLSAHFPPTTMTSSSAYVTIVGGFTHEHWGALAVDYGNWWDVSVVHSLRGHLGEQHVSIGSLRPGSMSLGVQHRCWQDQTRLTVRGWVSEESRKLSCQICNSLEVKRL